MEYVIEANHLSKSYGSKKVLHDINFKIPKGNIIAFLGPNGVGKTTTLKILMNILPPDKGSANVLGVDSRRLCSQQFQHIGYVSEDQELPSWMKVDQFLKFCQSLYKNWDNDFYAQLIKRFHLPMDLRIKDLSRGMRMKVALISSIAYRPKLLVMDEPFSGLDPLVREELISGVLDITENEDWTILISSHDIEEVERLADEVGIMNDGQVVLMETIEALLERFREIECVLEQPLSGLLPEKDEWFSLRTEGRIVRFVESRFDPKDSEEIYRTTFGGRSHMDIRAMTLRKIFLAVAQQFNIKGLKG